MSKFFKIIMVVLAVTSFSILPGIGFTEEVERDYEKTKEEVQKLEKIVVEARKAEESIAAESISAQKFKEVGHNVEIITGEEMEAAGFVDLAKALESLVPGLWSNTSQGRGGYNTIKIHGNKPSMLLDGVRINEIHGSTGNAWSYTLSVHMIDHIEILRGGESLFYGTGARGGVINIITKKITEEISGQVGMSFGDDGYREIYGHVTETINGHGLMAFGSFEGYDGYHVCDDQAYADALNTYGNKRIGSDRTTGGIKYRKEFDLAGKSVLNAQYRRHEGYFDYPDPYYRTADFDWNEEVASLKWDHDVNDTFSYNITAYYHRWWAELTHMNLDGSYLFAAEPVECDEYGVNFRTSTRWGKGHEFISGIDYRDYWGSFKWAYVNDFDRIVDYGIFASYRPYLAFSPNTKLAVSARYNHAGEEADATVWDVSMKTPIVGPIYARGSIRTDFTIPTLAQLTLDNPVSRVYGNPDLEPMKGLDRQIAVGADWRYFHCEVGYFFNEVDNMIKRVTLANGNKTYVNVEGKTEIDGFEASAGIGPFSGISFDVSATWTNAEDKDTGEQQADIPEFFGKANVRYRYKTGRFGGDLMARYTGDIYARDLGNNEDINYGDFFVVDASAFVTFGKEKRHKVTLRVENIFDKEYASGYATGWNTSGDSADFETYGLPRSVVVGYTYPF